MVGGLDRVESLEGLGIADPKSGHVVMCLKL